LDHLLGILFVDRLEGLDKLRRVKAEGEKPEPGDDGAQT